MKLRFRAVCLVAALTGLGVASPIRPVQAGPVAAATSLSTYNLVTTGNVQTYSDIEGSAIVGGNLLGAGTFFNNDVPLNPTVSVYGSALGSYNFDAGGRLATSGFANALTDYTQPLQTLSAQLQALTANSTTVQASGALNFNATPNANGVAVFFFTAASLQNLLANSRIQFNENGAKTVIVNVDGSFTEPSSTNWNGPALRNVLFNFYDATSVRVGNWESSLLAPLGTVGINAGNIEGSVFASAYVGGGELHNDPFNGDLSSLNAVDEPTSIVLLVSGVIGLGLGIAYFRRGSA